MKNAITIFVLCILAATIGYFAATYTSLFSLETHERTSSDVVLERIKTVSKLVTVEGYFSDVYSHEEYYGYDISYLRKKALLKVQAKISVGFDLGKMTFEIDEENKMITMSELPDVEIISVDHDVEYYDIQESTFNSFSAKDLTKINQKAKNMIMDKANTEEIKEEARRQGSAFLEMIEVIIEESGWRVSKKIEGLNEPELKD